MKRETPTPTAGGLPASSPRTTIPAERAGKAAPATPRSARPTPARAADVRRPAVAPRRAPPPLPRRSLTPAPLPPPPRRPAPARPPPRRLPTFDPSRGLDAQLGRIGADVAERTPAEKAPEPAPAAPDPMGEDEKTNVLLLTRRVAPPAAPAPTAASLDAPSPDAARSPSSPSLSPPSLGALLRSSRSIATSSPSSPSLEAPSLSSSLPPPSLLPPALASEPHDTSGPSGATAAPSGTMSGPRRRGAAWRGLGIAALVLAAAVGGFGIRALIDGARSPAPTEAAAGAPSVDERGSTPPTGAEGVHADAVRPAGSSDAVPPAPDDEPRSEARDAKKAPARAGAPAANGGTARARSRDPGPRSPQGDQKPAPASGDSDEPTIDRAALGAAMASAAAAAGGCKTEDGPKGNGRVAVTVAPSGRVSQAVVEPGPFSGTSVGSCVAVRFRSATVPPFTGGFVTVRVPFQIW